MGDRGDDPLEEEGFDDLGAFDAQLVGQLLHREVALRYHQHFGPYLLGLAGLTQLHGAAALALTGGFLLATTQGHRPCPCLGCGTFGLAGASQAGLKHQCFLTTGEATGLCGQGVVVLPNDVHLLALPLR